MIVYISQESRRASHGNVYKMCIDSRRKHYNNHYHHVVALVVAAAAAAEAVISLL